MDFLFILQDSEFERVLKKVCEDESVICEFVSTFDEALKHIDSNRYQFVFVDLDQDELRPLQLLEWLRTRHITSSLGILGKKGYGERFLHAMRLGVTEFLSMKSLDQALLKNKITDLSNRNRISLELSRFHLPHDSRQVGRCLVGNNSQVRRALECIQYWNSLSVPILIQGESGVGKRLLAEILSKLPTEKLVINFDAGQTQEYEQKEKFLDLFKPQITDDMSSMVMVCVHEIGQWHPELQEMMADYFKEGQLEIDGELISVWLQLVGTSSQDLSQLCEQGNFRKDLYLMFQQYSLLVPPLRSRKDDLPELVEYFIEELNPGSKTHYFSEDALTALVKYDWPENVAELKATISEILRSADENMISAKQVPPKILGKSFYMPQVDDENLTDFPYNEAKKRVLNKFNCTYIAELLERSEHNLTVAAEKAGMDRSNFKKIIKKYGLTQQIHKS